MAQKVLCAKVVDVMLNEGFVINYVDMLASYVHSTDSGLTSLCAYPADHSLV